jgi:tetratricopeptide (TPR) repeat protein
LHSLPALLPEDNPVKALAWLHYFIDNDAADPLVRLQTGMAYVHVAGVHYVQGEGAQAIAAWERAITVFSGLVSEFPEDSIYRIELAQGQFIFGQYLYAHKDRLLAGVQFARASDNYREAVLLDEDADAINLLTWFSATCPDAQFRDPQRAVDLATKAVALGAKQSLARNLNTLGTAQYRAGVYEGAIETLGKSIELNSGGSAADWLFLAMAHWRLGHKEEARRWYDKSIPWMARNSPSMELDCFRAEAVELLGIPQTPLPAKQKPKESNHQEP